MPTPSTNARNAAIGSVQSVSRRQLRLFTMQLLVGLMLTVGAYTLNAAQVVSQMGQTFTLTEHLGMSWEHELVTFELDEAALAKLTGGDNRLLDPAGKNIPFQIIQREDKKLIAFHADLQPQSTNTWRLTNTPLRYGNNPFPNAKLSVKQLDGYIELTNGVTGLRIHTAAANAVQGPIAALLLPTGQWVGQGSLKNMGEIQSYKATITQEGWVLAEVTAEYLFADGGTWKATFQLNDGEPVVIIHESMQNLPEEARWAFNLPAADAPNHLLYRAGNDGRPAQTLQDALIAIKLDGKPPKDEVFEGKTRKDPYVWQLHPWHHWWQFNDAAAYQLMYLPQGVDMTAVENKDERANDWFIYKSNSTDQPASISIPSLLIAAGKAGSWTVPGKNGKNHGFTLKPAEDGSVNISIGLNWPSRIWLLGSAADTRTAYMNKDVSLAHAMLIKHLDRPLDEIKELVLAWPKNQSLPYPQLFPSQARLQELRDEKMEIGFDINRARLALKKFILDPSSNPEMPAKLAANGINGSMTFAAGFFLNATPSNGTGRNAAINSSQHQIGRKIEAAALAADLAFGYGQLSQADENLIRARLALAAYYIAGDDVVSPERGLAQLENMTAMLYGGLGLVAAVIPDHPLAKQWAARTSEVFEKSLQNWCGPNGGWIECPHYQLASLNSFLMFGFAAANSGISDFIYDERIKKSVAFLAKITSPQDPRFNHTRHLPPIGNTYLNVQSDIFAIMAAIYKDRDPQFASQMQWMWEEQGKPSLFVIGGDTSIQNINSFLYRREIKPVNPNYQSEQFPLFGAVFRNAFATADETYMVYHHGRASGHYDVDQGSFEMWAKGQPLMLDWGYYHRMPAWQHNTATFTNGGRITQFNTTPNADYAKAQQEQWDRDILFIKAPQNDGPAYFVIQDDVKKIKNPNKSNALWYWFNTKENPTRQGQTIHITAAENVMLDVWLDKNAADSLAGYDTQSWSKQLAEMKKQNQSPPENIDTSKLVKTSLVNIPAWEGQGHKYWKRGATIQHGLSIPVKKDQRVTTVLFPREQSQSPVNVQPIADGNGLQVTFDQGQDYLFASDETIDVAPTSDIRFQGKAGVIQIRQNRITLTLFDGQSIRYQNHVLTSDAKETNETKQAISRSFDR